MPYSASHRQDPDVRVEQQIQRDALLRAAALDAERLPVAPYEADVALGRDPAQRLAALGLDRETGVDGEVGGLRDEDVALLEEDVHLFARQDQFGHSGPAGGARDGELRAVLLGEESDGGCLDPERKVLRHDGDVVPLGLQVAGDREDAGVVVPQAIAAGQHAGVRVVELDPDRSAEFPDRDGGVEATVPDPELVQHAQGLPGEVAEFGMVPLGLQLCDHDDRQHDFVLVEAVQCVRVGQQNAGVENIGAPVRHAALCAGHHGRTYPLGRGRGATERSWTGPGRDARAENRPSVSPVLTARSNWCKGPPGRTAPCRPLRYDTRGSGVDLLGLCPRTCAAMPRHMTAPW